MKPLFFQVPYKLEQNRHLLIACVAMAVIAADCAALALLQLSAFATVGSVGVFKGSDETGSMTVFGSPKVKSLKSPSPLWKVGSSPKPGSTKPGSAGPGSSPAA